MLLPDSGDLPFFDFFLFFPFFERDLDLLLLLDFEPDNADLFLAVDVGVRDALFPVPVATQLYRVT